MQQRLQYLVVATMLLMAIEAHSFLKKHQPTLVKTEGKYPGKYCDGKGNWYSGSTCRWYWYPTLTDGIEMEATSREECLEAQKKEGHAFVAISAKGGCFGLKEALPQTTEECSSSTKDGYCFCGDRLPTWQQTGSDCLRWYHSDQDPSRLPGISYATTDSQNADKVVSKVLKGDMYFGKDKDVLIAGSADGQPKNSENEQTFVVVAYLWAQASGTQAFKKTWNLDKDKVCVNGVTSTGYCYCFLDDEDPTWQYTGSDCLRWYHSDQDPSSTVSSYAPTDSQNADKLVSKAIKGDMYFGNQKDVLIAGSADGQPKNSKKEYRFVVTEGIDSMAGGTQAFKKTYNLDKDKVCVNGVTNTGYCYCLLDDEDQVP